jgi:hypothetical protein
LRRVTSASIQLAELIVAVVNDIVVQLSESARVAKEPTTNTAL